MLEEALETPPLPCLRGAIKTKCEEHYAVQFCGTGVAPHGIKVSIMRAVTRNPRTAVRVQLDGSSSKVSWAEVSAQQSNRHEEIIQTIAALVRNGPIVDKAGATDKKFELLRDA